MKRNHRLALPEENGCFKETKWLKNPLNALIQKISPFEYRNGC
jgi:hypothetical protein